MFLGFLFLLCFSKGPLSSIILRFSTFFFKDELSTELHSMKQTSLLEILPLASWNFSMKFERDVYLTPNVILMKTLFLIP